MIKAFVLALALALSTVGAGAQQPAAPPVPQSAAPAPQAPDAPPAPQAPEPLPPFDDFGQSGDEVVRIGSDYVLAAGDETGDLVVIMGTATVEGRVNGDLVVVLGEARLGPQAVIEGDLVVVGGSLAVQPGTTVRRDVVVVGGGLDAPSGFMPGGEQVVVGFRALGDRVRGLLPWLMRGLLWARPVVPDLGWVWAFIGVVFLLYLAVLLIFDHPVRVAADTLAETPLKALVTGLVVLLLLGPIVLLLAASVIGLLVVPVALGAVFVAGLIGKIAVARWLGSRLVSEGEHSRLLLARSFAIGSVLLILVYMVPILGGVVWALAGATGLGAAWLAFVAAYRKENPPPPQPVVPIPPPAPPPPILEGSLGSAAAFTATPAGETVGVVPPLPMGDAPILFPRASFTDRAAAFALDLILVGITIGLLEPLDDEMFVPLFLAYRFAFWAWKGATVGSIICQLRVTRIDGTRLGPAEALVRSLASIFSIGVLGIGCLWVLRDPEQQAWHDKIAGTFVVKVPRHWPL